VRITSRAVAVVSPPKRPRLQQRVQQAGLPTRVQFGEQVSIGDHAEDAAFRIDHNRAVEPLRGDGIQDLA